ncbi:MAG: DEAD/DEAH box helicase, partial [Deltaproteobacteria bacterium]|nr:DEAD/DEAH box helicase [Deltaproteobacteria bacterium]
MDIKSFIADIKKRKDLREVVHHEEIPLVVPSYGETSLPLCAELKEALLKLGIRGLYSHQAVGIDMIRDGKILVIMTPTASGKSLIYNIPVIEAMIEDKDSSAL